MSGAAQQQHWVSTAYASATDGEVDVGHCLMLNAAGTRYVPATAANRATSGRSNCGGLALSSRPSTDRVRGVNMQVVGPCPPEITGLGTGADDVPIIVGDDGFLERKASPDPGDIVVGKCDADGWAYLNFSIQGAQGPPGEVDIDAEPGEILIANADASGAEGVPLGTEGQVVGIVSGENAYRDVAEVEAGTVGHMAGYATADGDLEDIGVVPSVIAGDNVTVDALANNVYRVNAEAGGGAYATFDVTTTDENAVEAYELDVSAFEDGTYALSVRAIGDAGVDGSDEAHVEIEMRMHFMVRSGVCVSRSQGTLVYSSAMPEDFEPVTVAMVLGQTGDNPVVTLYGEEDTTIDWTGEVMLGIGLAISPGSGWGGSTPAFNPATLSLTGWWRANYTGSPWVGVASAGSSGSRELTEGTNPPATGSAINGLTPADFDGTNDMLNASTVGATNLEHYFTTSAYSYSLLIWADSATADAGNSDGYTMPGLIGDGSFATPMGCSFSSSGIRAWHNASGNWDSVAVACSTGGLRSVQVRYNGTTLSTRVNGGSWSDQARGNVGISLAAGFRIGRNYASVFFDGKIVDIMTASTALTDTNFNNINAYYNSRYGTSF